MKRCQPELYRKSSVFMQSKDFVTFRLTDRAVTDPTDGSGVLGMELSTGTWSRDFLADSTILP